MKYLIFFLTLFLFFTNCFSQYPKFKSSILTNNSSVVNNPNSRDNTLVVENVLLPTNKRFDSIFTSGLRWGVYGGSVGLLAAYVMDLNDECDKGLCYVFLPPLGSSIGLISGLIYGYLSVTKQDFDASKFNYGLQINYEGTISKQRKFGINYGIVYRRPNKNYYIPDNYYIYFGQEEWDTRPGDPSSDYSSYSESEFNQNRFGIELTKTNYNRTFSFIYGIGLGYSSGIFRERISEPIYKVIDEQHYVSLYIDLLLGININVFKFLHTQLFYKFEPLGPYESMRHDSGFTNSIKHSLSFSARCFLF